MIMMMSVAGIRWMDRRCPQAMEKSRERKVNYMIRLSERLLIASTFSYALTHSYTHPTRTILPSGISFVLLSFFSYLDFDRHTAFKSHCNLCQNSSSLSDLSTDCLSASTCFKDQVPNSLRHLAHFKAPSSQSTASSNPFAQPLVTLLSHQGVPTHPSFALSKTIHSYIYLCLCRPIVSHSKLTSSVGLPQLRTDWAAPSNVLYASYAYAVNLYQLRVYTVVNKSRIDIEAVVAPMRVTRMRIVQSHETDLKYPCSSNPASKPCFLNIRFRQDMYV